MHEAEAEEIYRICDLCRINGIGPVAARIFHDAGYKSAYEVAKTNANCLLESVARINDTRQYYRGKLGLKDMQFCIDYARLLLSLDE